LYERLQTFIKIFICTFTATMIMIHRLSYKNSSLESRQLSRSLRMFFQLHVMNEHITNITKQKKH